LRLRFICNLPAVRYEHGLAHFDISIVDHEVVVGGTIPYTRGWMHYIIALGDTVPSDTDGLIGGNIDHSEDWRYCKEVYGDSDEPTLVYWNGAEWTPVPSTWKDPIGTKLSGMGVWNENGVVKHQYGKREWPDPVPEWSDEALAQKQLSLADVSDMLGYWWTYQFDLKRDGCLSTDVDCCRFRVKCTVNFAESSIKRKGGIILCENDTRANSDAWSYDSGSQTWAHEFGHHLGNPDEYLGAGTVDPSVNGDGATAGIDELSIMGEGDIVRRRHYKYICSALSKLVSKHLGKKYTYSVVDCIQP
jgi:hypothetical protein